MLPSMRECLGRPPPRRHPLTDVDQSFNMKLPSCAELRSLSTSDRNTLFPSSESATPRIDLRFGLWQVLFFFKPGLLLHFECAPHWELTASR